MLASEQAIHELALPRVELRPLARRAAVPVLLGAAAATFVVLAGGKVHAIGDALHRTLSLSVGWAFAAILLESLSIAGYVLLLSLVAGRANARIGARESAQITLAGTVATRLLPTAGAGGAALTIWTLRRSGLHANGAVKTLLRFFVLLYAVFLAAIAIAGAMLSLHVVASHGPTVLSLTAAISATGAITVALLLAQRGSAQRSGDAGRLRRRAEATADLLGGAVREGIALVRQGDVRLLGAIAYWGFDAAVLWATLHAVGAAPPVPVIVLAYFVGQVANTLPLPGSVSGGIAGVLVAFGVPIAIALPAVLAYRAIAVWLPSPAALIALPGFRATLSRWAAEDAINPSA
jgi:putative heme transporter